MMIQALEEQPPAWKRC